MFSDFTDEKWGQRHFNLHFSLNKIEHLFSYLRVFFISSCCELFVHIFCPFFYSIFALFSFMCEEASLYE